VGQGEIEKPMFQKTEDREQKTEKIKSYKDLKVHNLAYGLAMEIFEMSKKFPKEETYSMVDQIRRSSRSVVINIREGFAKRRYGNIFMRHLDDALGSSEETRGWLKFAVDCKYISQGLFTKLDSGYDEVNAMLFTLINNWQ
jgi:four helix bundle protein